MGRMMYGRLIVALFAISCGGSGESYPGLVTVKVWPLVGKTADGAPKHIFNDYQISKMKISVTGPNISGGYSQVLDFGAHEGDVTNIPLGYSRQVTVETCVSQCNAAVSGDIVGRGHSMPFDALDSTSKQQVNVFVAPRNSLATPIVADELMSASQPAVADRIGATVTELADGRLLICGGARLKPGSNSWFRAADFEALSAQAEIFDPRDGRFTSVGPMTKPRAFHQAVRLRDGTVWILAGYVQEGGNIRLDNSVEKFNPTTGLFELTNDKVPPPAGGRALFTAALVSPDFDAILVAGGIAENPENGGAFAEVLMPGVGIVGRDDLQGIRYNHSMQFVPDFGRGVYGPEGVPAFVLFGGENGTQTISKVEVITVSGYKVKNDESATQEIPGGGRTLLSTVFVPQQRMIYVVGGFEDTALQKPSPRVDVFHVDSRNFVGVLGLSTPRGAGTATLMDNNTILIAGGVGPGGATLGTFEVIGERLECVDPVTQTDCRWVVNFLGTATPSLDPPRAAHLAVFDRARRVFMIGGFSSIGASVREAVLYNPD